MEKLSALHTSELAKLPHDPDDPNEDLWELTIQVRSLREQLEAFEAECRQKMNEQLCTLEGLLNWCDHLLYLSCALYSKRSQERDIPEG